MKEFEIQSIELNADYNEVFDYISNPKNLPEWTNAFESVSGAGATLKTPAGTTEVGLVVMASRNQGTIDWLMTFPDGSSATAYSRLVELKKGRNAYSFILTPSPEQLNRLEGTLTEQAQILKKELERLCRILEKRK